MLDLDNGATEKVRIDLIVISLPVEVQNKLKRNKLSSIEELFKELSSLDANNWGDETNSKKDAGKIRGMTSVKSEASTPCSICNKRGKQNRFHPESKCWFKKENKKINFLACHQLEEDLPSDSSSEENQKN